MKFNIYYGRGEDFSKQELINSLDNIEQAEKFLFDYLKEYHPNSGYIRINYIWHSKTIWLWSLYNVLHNYKSTLNPNY